MLEKIKVIIKDPVWIVTKMASMNMLSWISDKKYLSFLFRVRCHQKMNWENPQTFNEKMQWLKIYDRKDIYTTMVDKYEAKRYVVDLVGEQYVIPTIGVWDKVDEINFDELPNEFVLKCTHDSGGLIICKDKSRLNLREVRKKLNKCLKRNYYWTTREWPYKNVKRRIIAEKFMVDETEAVLPVYKFFCFDGEPTIIQTIKNDKMKNETIDYFDSAWNRLDMRQNFPNSEIPLEKPANLDEMLALAKQLSVNKKGFIRVDLYSINGAIYFSEYTFFSDTGLAVFSPANWDIELGKLIDI